MQHIAWALHRPLMSRSSHQNHCEFLYYIMELFSETSMKCVIQDVIDFYIRNNLAQKDRYDILNITVSLDGAYSRRGSESSVFVSVIIDVERPSPRL